MSNFNPSFFLTTATVIETEPELREFLEEIQTSKVIAVDTESAGFYKYHQVVNLIQVATSKAAAIIDPQVLINLDTLKSFAAESPAQWVFHGASYDARVLFREFGIKLDNIFDTRLAAEFLGLPELGLSSLSLDYLGFSLNKKLQRCDWSRRPLTKAMRDYSLLDAICLLPLHEILMKKLKEKKRLEWVLEECRVLLKAIQDNPPSQENSFSFLIKGSKVLPQKALAVLKEIWTFRDHLARKIDRAPFMILNNQTLLEVARRAPQTIPGLSTIRGFSPTFLEKNGNGFIQAIKTGLNQDWANLKLPTKSESYRNSLSAWQGEICKTLKEARNKKSNMLQIPASLLASSETLGALVKSCPASLEELQQTGIMRKWQISLLGEEFLEILSQDPPRAPKKKARRGRHSGG